MIRKLQIKDAERMCKCLSDKENVKFMQIGQEPFTNEKCEAFIEHSFSEINQHFAIVDEKDEWVGTISLKKIDHMSLSAEYAIITAQEVHGKGYAQFATIELIEYAFSVLKLNRVYLNVLKDNIRANRFYEKCGFEFEGCARQAIRLGSKFYDLNWYAILKGDR